MLQAGRTLWIVAICATAASAQDVIELARNAPPELFADAVIRLAERGKIPEGPQRKALLEEAFEAAKKAKEPVKLVAVPQFADRQPGRREAALRAGLDALSLEDRILTLMAAADPDRARELFQAIDHPQLDPRPCADPMIADDSAYFDMARAVGQVNPMLLMGPGNSPGELASFADLLLADRTLSRDQFQLLAGALGLKMQTAALDYRAFTVTAENLAKVLDALTRRARELGVSADALGEGAKKMAVAQLGAPRCQEEFGGAIAFVEWFNRTFATELQPIVHDQMIGKEDLGPAKAEAFFATDSGKSLSAEFSRLRAERLHGGSPKPDWAAESSEFMQKWDAWTPAGNQIEAFDQKMIVAHGLYELIPPGEARDQVAEQVVAYLKGNPVEREAPAEWLFEVKSFIEFELTDKAKLLAAFRASGDPGLGLFAALN
jgi:hypothetical protein